MNRTGVHGFAVSRQHSATWPTEGKKVRQSLIGAKAHRNPNPRCLIQQHKKPLRAFNRGPDPNFATARRNMVRVRSTADVTDCDHLRNARNPPREFSAAAAGSLNTDNIAGAGGWRPSSPWFLPTDPARPKSIDHPVLDVADNGAAAVSPHGGHRAEQEPALFRRPASALAGQSNDHMLRAVRRRWPGQRPYDVVLTEGDDRGSAAGLAKPALKDGGRLVLHSRRRSRGQGTAIIAGAGASLGGRCRRGGIARRGQGSPTSPSDFGLSKSVAEIRQFAVI